MCLKLVSMSLIKRLQEVITNKGKEPYKSTFSNQLHSVLQGKLRSDVYVDDWPKVTAASVFTHGGPYKDKALSLYSDDTLKCMDMLDSALPWGSRILCTAIPSHLMDDLAALAESHNHIIETTEAEYFPAIKHNLTHENTSLKYCKLAEGFTLGTLDPKKHVKLVTKYWDVPLDYDTRLHRVSFILNNYRSISVLNSGHEPVSWGIMQADGTSGMGFTLPGYRAKGLIQVIIQGMNRIAFEEGFLRQIGYLRNDNLAVHKSQELSGTKLYKNHHVVYGSIYPSNNVQA